MTSLSLGPNGSGSSGGKVRPGEEMGWLFQTADKLFVSLHGAASLFAATPLTVRCADPAALMPLLATTYEFVLPFLDHTTLQLRRVLTPEVLAHTGRVVELLRAFLLFIGDNLLEHFPFVASETLDCRARAATPEPLPAADPVSLVGGGNAFSELPQFGICAAVVPPASQSRGKKPGATTPIAELDRKLRPFAFCAAHSLLEKLPSCLVDFLGQRTAGFFEKWPGRYLHDMEQATQVSRCFLRWKEAGIISPEQHQHLLLVLEGLQSQFQLGKEAAPPPAANAPNVAAPSTSAGSADVEQVQSLFPDLSTYFISTALDYYKDCAALINDLLENNLPPHLNEAKALREPPKAAAKPKPKPEPTAKPQPKQAAGSPKPPARERRNSDASVASTVVSVAPDASKVSLLTASQQDTVYIPGSGGLPANFGAVAPPISRTQKVLEWHYGKKVREDWDDVDVEVNARTRVMYEYDDEYDDEGEDFHREVSADKNVFIQVSEDAEFSLFAGPKPMAVFNPNRQA